MYNDEIKVANKIISYDALNAIFAKMYEDLEKYKKIYKNEEMRNRMLDSAYQTWSFKDNDSKLSFRVEFSDNTSVKFDNYNNFTTVFNNRLEEVKSVDVNYSLSYSTVMPGEKREYYNQHIYMYIYEKKADFNFSLSSVDRKMDEVYELIKDKITNAPLKYDDIIKRKSSINSTVGFSIAFIPALVICTLLLFVPTIRSIFSMSYVLYPICCFMIAFMLSGSMSAWKLEDLYKNILPDKKYVSYEKGYKDDIDKYIETSEILIGKNVHNLENRKEIMKIYDKYKKYIPYEIGVLGFISIIVIFIGWLQ